MSIRNAKELGVVIRARRKEKRLTQTELAELAGASLRFITELERGARTEASISKVLTVLGRLGLDVHLAPREDVK